MGVVPTIDAACRDVGFFQVVGHGLDRELEDTAWAAAGEFLHLPLEARSAVSTPEGGAYGYGPFAVERFAASFGDVTPPEMKETFSIGPLPSRGESNDDPAATSVFSATPWSAALPELEPVMLRSDDALAELVGRLTSLMATGLGPEATAFDDAIDRHTSALRLPYRPDLSGHGVEPGQSSRCCVRTTRRAGSRCGTCTGRGTTCPPSTAPTWSTAAMRSSGGPTTGGGARSTGWSRRLPIRIATARATRSRSSPTRTGTQGSSACRAAPNRGRLRDIGRSEPVGTRWTSSGAPGDRLR